MILSAATDTIQLVLAGAKATTDCPYTVSYIDGTITTYTPTPGYGTTNGVTAVTVVSGPTANQRRVQEITVFNADTAAVTLSVRFNNNATTYVMAKLALDVGDSFIYNTGDGFRVLDSTGSLKTKLGGLVPSGTGFRHVTAGVEDSPAQLVTNADVSASAAIALSKITGAAASGANSDITSLTGLLTPLPVSEGGSGSATASGARTNFGLVIGTNVEAWDPTLDALAGISATTGFLTQTAADTFAQRTIVAGIGTAVNNPAGVAGNPSIDTLVMRGMFGNAADGTVDPGSVNLTRSQAYGSITIAGTLGVSGYEVCCSGTLTVNGTLNAGGGNGSNASGTNQGTGGNGGGAAGGGDYGGSQAGSAGANGGTGAGAQATNTGGTMFLGSAAGSGGASGLGSGGAGVATRASGAITARGYQRAWFENRMLAAAAILVSAGGGIGGGSGGGDGTNVGGGGGGGGAAGGYVVIRAKNIVIGAAGLIHANGGFGGNGGSPTVTTGGCGGGGGGGGGNGGIVLLIYETITITAGGAITASAGTFGTKGTKTGTGVDGANGTGGSAGIVLKYNITTGAFE